MSKKLKFPIYLDEQEHEFFKKMAKRQRMSMTSYIVKMALDRSVEIMERKEA